MPYTKTNWVDGQTPINAANLNKLETQYESAIADIEDTERTPDDDAIPSTSGVLDAILNYLATMIRKISGQTSWVSEPPITLAQTKSSLRDLVQIGTNITLTAANWVDDTANSGYWIYDVTDADVTSTTIVDVYIHRASQQTAQDAGVQPFCESANGSFRLFAESQPAGSITIDAKKTRQVVS